MRRWMLFALAFAPLVLLGCGKPMTPSGKIFYVRGISQEMKKWPDGKIGPEVRLLLADKKGYGLVVFVIGPQSTSYQRFVKVKPGNCLMFDKSKKPIAGNLSEAYCDWALVKVIAHPAKPFPD